LGGVLKGDEKNPRLAALRTFAAQRPKDPFPRYALAMELKGAGEPKEAWAIFEALIAEHPDYVASYSPAGDVLVALGRAEDARMVYRKGIDVCARHGEAHIRANLEEALAEAGEPNR
jgi:predicted Zn-dependent protease